MITARELAELERLQALIVSLAEQNANNRVWMKNIQQRIEVLTNRAQDEEDCPGHGRRRKGGGCEREVSAGKKVTR